MLTIGASIMASLVGYVVDALVEPFLGVGARIFIGIVVGAYVFVYARNWLRDLRG
jgi:ABC-type branched-subunit amino acid transport system permease subunit